VGGKAGVVTRTVGVFVGRLGVGVLVGVGVLLGEGDCVGSGMPPVIVTVGVRVGVRVGVAVQVGGSRVPPELVAVGVRVGVGVEVDGGGVVAGGSGVLLGSSVWVGVGPVADGPSVAVGPGVLVNVGTCVAPEGGVVLCVGEPSLVVEPSPVDDATGQGVGVAVGAPTIAATREATSSGDRVSPALATTNVDKALIVPESAVS